MINLNGEWKLNFCDKNIDVIIPSVIEKYIEKLDDFSIYTYTRDFSMTKIGVNSRYILNCEGISYKCKIFINSQEVIIHEGVWEHFKVDITNYLKQENELPDSKPPGMGLLPFSASRDEVSNPIQPNEIKIEITRADFDKNSPYFYRSTLFGFIPDILLPFSGIFRPIYIEEKQESYFEDIRVMADFENKMFTIKTKIQNFDNCKIHCTIIDPNGKPYRYTSEIEDVNCPVEMITWSNSSPNLYDLKIRLIKDNQVIDTYKYKRGFRNIEISGNKILVNGEQVFFRGILHWGYYPEEMSVHVTKEKIKLELENIKRQGFNAVKFCLFFPEPYYYELCDELGIFVWQEMPLWLPYDNGYLVDRIKNQFPKMINKFIDHPSLLLVSIGCELDDTVSQVLLDEIYDKLKDNDSNIIICDNSGGGECFDGNTTSKNDIYDYHFYSEIHNMQNLINSFNHESREAKPFLFGEYNDADTFRNLKNIEKKLGYSPFWASKDFEKNLLRYVHQGFGSDNPIYNFHTIVENYGYEDILDKICNLSIKKAYDLRKFNLETTRSNKSISGYSITAIRDVPITSCGIFDDFNDCKFKNNKMEMINGDIVISMLAKLGRKWYRGSDILETSDIFNFLNGTSIDNRIIISSHLPNNLDCLLVISLFKKDKLIHKDNLKVEIEKASSKKYTDLNISLPKSEKIEKYNLNIQIISENTRYENNWTIWSYSEKYDTNKFYVLDNNDYFENITNIFNCELVNSVSHLENTVLLTTYLNDDIIKLNEKNVKIIYVQNGNGYFKSENLPFWRENVKYIAADKYFDELKHDGYDSLQFLSVAGNIGFDSNYILEKYPNYNSIIKRIDNRNFKTHEIVFKPYDGLIVTCLNLKGGSGVEARNFSTNYFAQGIVDKLVKILSEV